MAKFFEKIKPGHVAGLGSKEMSETGGVGGVPPMVTGEELFELWKGMKSRDEALLEARRQRYERLLSLHRAVLEKVQVLLCSKAGGLDDQGLIADLDALEAAIRGTGEAPCSPSGT